MNGEYTAAKPVAGTVLVNIGDLMQQWTADKLRSTVSWVGDVRVPKTLTSKTRRSAQPFLWNWVLYLHENEKHFHIIGWALNLVLIQRPRGTRKWPIKAYSPLTRLSLAGVGAFVLSLTVCVLKGRPCPCWYSQSRQVKRIPQDSINELIIWKLNPSVVPVKSVKIKLAFLHTKWAVNILRELELVSHGDGGENHRQPKL